jgi:uncharacterized protein YlbG (UPF0298 family)
MQIIDGAKADVEQLFSKIERETCHKHVTLLSQKFVDQRDFPEYKTSFKRAQWQSIAQDLPPLFF